MKTHCVRYLLVMLGLLCISTGCRETTRRIDFFLEGHVWWGENLAVGDSVQAIFTGISFPTFPTITITNTVGRYLLWYTEDYATDKTEILYKIRSQDSLGVWSEYKEGIITGEIAYAIVDFHL